MGNINVAIIGVGNCASSLVQGVNYNKKAKEIEFVPGLMHVNLGGYHISDINFVAAFETLSGDPSWRPGLRVHWSVSLLGGVPAGLLILGLVR